MLHKAAYTFSPFKLQHLHAHVRSALNLNLGNNVGSNLGGGSNAAGAGSSSAGGTASNSSSALGGPASTSGGTGGSEWAAGKSYGYHAYGRGNGIVNATAISTDGTAGRTGDDESEEAKRNGKTLAASFRWRNTRTGFAGRRRTSSLSNPGLTTGAPILPKPITETEEEGASRSTPYSFNEAELQARYRHAFSQAKQSQQQLLLKPAIPIAIHASEQSISTFGQKRTFSTRPIISVSTPSSPRATSSKLPISNQQLTRRNSTSAATASSDIPSTVVDDVISAASIADPSQSTIAADPLSDLSEKASRVHPSDAVSQRYSFDEPPPEDVSKDVLFTHLHSLVAQSDLSRLRATLRQYRAKPISHSANRHGLMIHALYNLQHFGVSPTEILSLYEEFAVQNMTPPKHIYSLVMDVLCNRSMQTHNILRKQQLQNNASRLAKPAASWAEGNLYTYPTSTPPSDPMYDQSSLAALKQQSDEDFAYAKRLLQEMGSTGRLAHRTTLNALLSCCAVRGDVDTALIAFGQLEGDQRTYSQATPESFKNLLLTYARANDLKGVETIFDGFLKGVGRAVRLAAQEQSVKAADLLNSQDDKQSNVNTSAIGGQTNSPHQTSLEDAQVWNAMIYSRVLFKDGPAALELLEQMMQRSKATPDPNARTLLSLIRGFSESGDLESSFRWAQRIHASPTPTDLPTPSPRMEETLNTIISASGSAADGEKIQSAAKDTELLPLLGMHIQLLAGITQPQQNDTQERSSLSPIDTDGQSSSAGSSFELGSIFSDPSLRSSSMAITPPPLPHQLAPEDQVKEEQIVIDLVFSAKIDDLLRTTTNPSEIYGIIKSERREGVHAHPEALGRLVDKLAVNKAPMTEIQDTYLTAYHTIGALQSEHEQTAAWAYLENRMLISMANLGELEKAAMHRDRLLQAGAAPTADAYAAMITSARDTTDDATVALELFEEARRFGVAPNLFLFNILISKLSKARRTHLALSYFEQMKSMGIRPSAVTYGSVIAACCRTGDEKAATFLFNEMTRAPGFRPRVPPYNTMMQFFITTRPDREKALSYFDALLRAKVSPTGHTYKLLLDAYGAIEPVDVDSVTDVFERLVADKQVAVTGVHWAALLNTYGCVANDLDHAKEVFDSIASHPSSASSKITMPDVICYEGLFNVFLTHNRQDLIEEYLEKMHAQFVRPTAYIFNTLIRACAAAGNLPRAREMFESLSDPSSGVAAPGNHALDPSTAAPASTSPTIYREPSTFEAMIRCEIAAGQKEKAEALLERAIARAFPSAVIARLQRLVKGEDHAGPLFTGNFLQ